MMRFVPLMTALILAGSCQTYDFERVVPLAVAQTTDKTIVASKRLKPNVMLLVDNSGSMLLPTDLNAPGCPAPPMPGVPGCGTPGNLCPGTCPTRISELKSAMATFIQTSGTIARLGATVYPAASQCGASSNIDVQLPMPTATDDGTDAALASAANAVNARIQVLMPSGGTPTGSSLDFLGTYGGINDNSDFRDDFVLLLTDGLPNCNPANPNNICPNTVPGGNCVGMCTQMQIDACNCTGITCAPTTLCSNSCLDQQGAVDAVKRLRLKGIRTIVVGFGADLAAGAGPVVLNAMAREGGFARECPNSTDGECGGQPGSCNTATKQCSTSFFQAANGTELAAALRKISESFQGDPCEFTLSARPSDPRYLSVVVNGSTLAEGAMTYRYDPNSNKVTFLGSQCTALNASTTQNPVNVEFRIVERF